MRSRRIALAVVAGAGLLAPAAAAPLGPVQWMSLCVQGRADIRLLPVAPDDPRREERTPGSACHAVLTGQRKLARS